MGLIATILRQNGLLILVVVGLLATLLLTNPHVLDSFQSLKFGSTEVTFRASASSRADTPQVPTRNQRSKENLSLVWGVPDYIKRALFIEGLSGKSGLPALESFDEFRGSVITPVAILDGSLLNQQIDLFDGSPKVRLLVDILKSITAPASTLSQDTRRDEFLAGLKILKGVLADASISLSSRLSPDAFAEVSTTTGQIGEVIGDVTRYQDSLGALSDNEKQRTIDGIVGSGYLVYLTYNLMDLSYFSDGLSNDKVVAYFNLLYGGPSELANFANIQNAGYDFQSKLLIANKVLDEIRTYDSPENTFRFASELYDFAYSFAMLHYKAPADRSKPYSPCADVPEDDKAGKDLCLRIEYQTVPLLLNYVLFYPVQMRIEGKELPPAVTRQLQGFLEPLAVRAEMIRSSWHTAGRYENTARFVYVGLMDTLATSRAILAAEQDGKVARTTCDESEFEFAEALDSGEQIRKAASQYPPLSLDRSLIGLWQQISDIESRRHLVRQYCKAN